MKKQICLAAASLMLLTGCGDKDSTSERVTKPATTTENLVTATPVTTDITAVTEQNAVSTESTGLMSEVKDAVDSIRDTVTSLMTEAGKKLDGSR